jgi:hypothetical protein
MLGLPSLGGIAGWGRAVAEEIGRLPSTLRDARALLADLPARLDALVDALNTTTAALERVLPELERSMATVSTTRRARGRDGQRGGGGARADHQPRSSGCWATSRT